MNKMGKGSRIMQSKYSEINEKIELYSLFLK